MGNRKVKPLTIYQAEEKWVCGDVLQREDAKEAHQA